MYKKKTIGRVRPSDRFPSVVSIPFTRRINILHSGDTMLSKAGLAFDNIMVLRRGDAKLAATPTATRGRIPVARSLR